MPWSLRVLLCGCLAGICLAQAPAPGTLELGLRGAIDLALSNEGNLAVQIGDQAIQVAEARVGEARSALLPQLDGVASYTDFTRSFAAEGLTQIQLPFNLRVPSIVGPVQTPNARGQLRTNVLNFAAIKQYQASGAGAEVARSDAASIRQEVASATARQYATALRAAAQIEMIQANLNLAEEVLKEAQAKQEAGTGTGLEVARAELEITNQRQRLLAAQASLEQARLTLLQLMGQPLGTSLTLTERLTFLPLADETLEGFLQRAGLSRADLAAQTARSNQARLQTSAARADRLPVVGAFGDYGVTGNLDTTIRPIHTWGFSLTIPVLDGGRRASRVAAATRQEIIEETRRKQLSSEIELQIRVAWTQLSNAAQQVAASEQGLQVARFEIEQTTGRYESGLASIMEVNESQTRLARARDNNVEAIFAHTMAKIELQSAAGILLESVQ